MLRERALQCAAAASLALHAALVLATTGPNRPRTPATPAPLPPDVWSGTTFDAPDLLPPAAAHALNAAPSPAPEPPPAPTPAPGAPAATAAAAPARRPRPPRRAPPSPVGASSTVSASAAGQFGAAGPAAVRDLLRAFTRALPPANSADPFWVTAPLGHLPDFDVALSLDEAGAIVASAPVDPAAPDHARALLRRTVALLSGGRFGLPREAGPAARVVLRIAVEVTSSTDAPPEGVPAGSFGLGFDPPGEGRPGRAYFTLVSGKHVELRVRSIEPR